MNDECIETGMTKRSVMLDVQWDVVLADLWRSGYWILVFGFAAAFSGVYLGLFQNEWASARDGHGPFIQAVTLIIFILKAPQLKTLDTVPAPIIGWSGLVFSLLIMAVSHSQDIAFVSAVSMISTLMSLFLIFKGWAALRLMWFPLFFLIFSVPMPGWIMDSLTQPLKLNLSESVTNFLYAQGYPIAANGVVIFIGQYQLLVKDACAGLNSMHSLAAVGAFYIYASNPSSWLHRGFLILIILQAA